MVFLHKAIKVVHLGTVNYFVGAIFGLVKAMLIIGAILILVITYIPVQTDMLNQSKFGQISLSMTKFIVAIFPDEIKEKFKNQYEEFKI